ncbi:hypothetical protein [Nocardia sp. NPDC004604]|uniref:hypothetical protein n=1 Tax=Nocardia sp. NPDC004604 TaxID=3157013 RepID=UPI0033B0E207
MAATAPVFMTRFRPVPLCVAAILLIGIALGTVGFAQNLWWFALGNAVLIWADVLASIVASKALMPQGDAGNRPDSTRSTNSAEPNSATATAENPPADLCPANATDPSRQRPTGGSVATEPGEFSWIRC